MQGNFPKKFYPISYFIKLFEGVKEEFWSLSSDSNPSDAWEWVTDEDAQDALYAIVRPFGLLIHVNDGLGEYANLGETPKQRVINFLNVISKSRACALE